MSRDRPTPSPGASGGEAARSGELRRGRRALFAGITILVPVVLLACLEAALWAAGFAGRQPLFIEAPDVPGYLHANPAVMRRYVATGGEPTAVIEPILFRREKPADGYRIVVQGGSTAAGFPYGRWGGLAGMLGDRLERVFPEREVEVVTTAMAAVSSHTLVDLVEEILGIEPDAVLIYAGHNEYLGVLGVGSALAPARPIAAVRTGLALQNLRGYQALRRLGAWGREALTSVGGDRETLFARAAAGAEIAYGSQAYRAGLRQFRANLARILTRYRRAGVPVYVGTLVSNEKDLPPFAGTPAAAVDREAWERLLRAQRRHREAGDLPRSRRAIDRLLALDPDAADAWFARGRLEHRAGRIPAAREAYRGAKDRDRLRFRAPEAFNRIIRELAVRHGASLVDVQGRFAEASPDGIVGAELLLEHVHPNAEGYFLLADAFYDALQRDDRIGDWSGAPTQGEARRDMPITELDRILADHAMQELEAGYPFADPPRAVELPEPASEVERLARRLRAGELDWLHAMEELLQHYRRQGRLVEAARVARLVGQAYPADRAPNFAAAALLLQTGRPALACRYAARSLAATPEDPAALALGIRAALALGDRPRAREYRAQLSRVAPGHPLLRRASSPGARRALPGTR